MHTTRFLKSLQNTCRLLSHIFSQYNFDSLSFVGIKGVGNLQYKRFFVVCLRHVKAKLIRYIPLETVAIFFPANLYLKQGIG